MFSLISDIPEYLLPTVILVVLSLLFAKFLIILLSFKRFPFFKDKEVFKRGRTSFYLFFVALALFISIELFDYPSFIVVVKKFLSILLIYFFLRILLNLFDFYLYNFLKEYSKKTETNIDDVLLHIIKNSSNIIFHLIVIIYALYEFGYDISAFIVGLGVGGLALAMASQEIIKNFFGALIIGFDGTYKINERIKIGAYEGRVVDINLRSTIIELDNGDLVSIPNLNVLKSPVVKIKSASAKPKR